MPGRRSSMIELVDEEEEAAQWRKEAGLVRTGRFFGGLSFLRVCSPVFIGICQRKGGLKKFDCLIKRLLRVLS